jgi:3-isopropylmalate dehydrogenase
MDRLKILALGGDGIGPEVVASGLALLDVAAASGGLKLDVTEDLLHGAAYDRYGTFCRDETLAAAKASDAVLVGAVGGPKWDGIVLPGGAEMQDGLMRLRLGLDTFVGIRPARTYACLESLTPFRPGLAAGAEIIVLRELCGGAFFANPRGTEPLPGGGEQGFDHVVYTTREIERFAHAGFKLARRRKRRVVNADKANVMQSCALWRKIVSEVARGYPDVELTHFYADNLSYQLMRRPRDFDLVMADNLYGDVLSDEIGVLAGSLGLLPSACLPGLPDPGQRIAGGLYEPVHGTAPDIAGKGIANPIGTIMTVALLLEYAAARPDLARRIEAAVERALEAGHRTPDIGGKATTKSVTDAVIAAYRA